MPRQAGYRHHEDTRKKIQAKQLINRLQSHVDANAPGILDASQVNAAKALLNKVLPDLKAIELTGDDGGPIRTEQSFDLSNLDATDRDAIRGILTRRAGQSESGGD